jgi:hypothetical protein
VAPSTEYSTAHRRHPNASFARNHNYHDDDNNTRHHPLSSPPPPPTTTITTTTTSSSSATAAATTTKYFHIHNNFIPTVATIAITTTRAEQIDGRAHDGVVCITERTSPCGAGR